MRNASTTFLATGVIGFFFFATLMVTTAMPTVFGALATASLSLVCFALASDASRRQHTTQAKRLLMVGIALLALALAGVILGLV